MKSPSRRTVLASAAAAAVGALSWKLYSSETKFYPAGDLHDIFESYRPYAILIGRSYLQCMPAEADPEKLAFLIAGDRAALPEDEDALRRYVRDRIRQDFANGSIKEVDGWILSNTEARLCAMATLTAPTHDA